MKNIQVWQVVDTDEPRIQFHIWKNIKKFYNVEVNVINIQNLNQLKNKKVHLLLFDLVLPTNISYSVIDPIQNENKRLHTAVVHKTITQANVTLTYDKHIDYTFNATFDDKYIIAKLKTILKRKSGKYHIEVFFNFKNIEVDQLLSEVRVAGKIIDTTKKEFKIIRELVKHADKFTSKQELFTHIWGHEHDSSRVLDQYLYKIKKKLGEEVTLVYDRVKGLKLI